MRFYVDALASQRHVGQIFGSLQTVKGRQDASFKVVPFQAEVVNRHGTAPVWTLSGCKRENMPANLTFRLSPRSFRDNT